MAYVQGLQYLAEKLNPPADLDFHPLARSVLELRERVKEHVIFPKQDIIQGLGRIDPGTMSQWPQPTPTDIGNMDSDSAGARRHMSLLSCHLDSSVGGDAPQFPQLGFKWRTDQLDMMETLSSLPLKLPLPPHQGSKWPSYCPTHLDRRGKVACISCDCFNKELKFGSDWCCPQRCGDCLGHRRCFLESSYGSCSLRVCLSKRGNQQPRCHHEGTREEWCRMRAS